MSSQRLINKLLTKKSLETTHPTRVVLYARVSTENQKENGYSLADQIKALKRHASSQGWEVLEEIEESYAAKNFKRPKFQNLLDRLEKGLIRFEYVVGVKADRMSRDLLEYMEMKAKLKTLGVKFYVLDIPTLNSTSPMAKFQEVVHFALAETDNLARSQNTKRGMREAQRQGRWVNHAPYGYSIDRSERKPLLIPNSNARLVIKAFEEVSQGVFAAEHVRVKLLEEGMTLGKNQFLNMLRNPVYAGKILIKADEELGEKEDIVDGIHKPLISEELFCDVQDVMAGKRKGSVSKGKLTENFPLRGHLLCPSCHRQWTASFSKSRNNNRHAYYHCQSRCGERIRADIMHSQFIEYLNSLRIPKAITELYFEIVKDVFKADDKEKTVRIKELDEEAKKARRQIEELDERLLNREIDLNAFNRLLAKLEIKEQECISQSNELTNSLNVDYHKYLSFGFSLINNLADFYSNTTVEGKHRLLGSIFSSKLIFQNGKYRTNETSLLLALSEMNISGLQTAKKKKAGISSGQSNLAPRVGLEPTTP